MAINPIIKQKAEDIRSKIFGSEVRESLASGIEAISEDVEATIGRQGYVEEQFQNVIDETTDKDVISAPELIAARNGKSNLKTRLDDEHAQVTAQLQQTEEQASLTAQNQFRQVNKFEPKPIIVFTFDDGPLEDLTVMKPIFDSYGYKATTYIITEHIGKTTARGTPHMSVSQIKELADAGWEIGSHTLNHPVLSGIPEETIVKELRDSKIALNRLGFESNNFAYPNGIAPHVTKRLARNYYRSATLFNSNKRINKIPIDKTGLYRISLGSWFDSADGDDPITNTFNDYYKKYIDKAVNEKGLLIFCLHSWFMKDDATQMQYLKDTLAYCKSIGVAVMTLDEALDYYDNTLDIQTYRTDNTVEKKTQLGGNGFLYSDTIGVVNHLPIGSVKNSDPVNKYPPLISRVRIRNSDNAGFPFINCTIYTDNTTTLNGEVRQWCYENHSQTGKMKFRSANPTTGVWTPWVEYWEKNTVTVIAKRPFNYLGGTVTIQPGARRNEWLIDPPVQKNSHVVVTPTKPIPHGIVVSHFINDALELRIIFDNVSSSPVSFPYTDLEFNILVVANP